LSLKFDGSDFRNSILKRNITLLYGISFFYNLFFWFGSGDDNFSFVTYSTSKACGEDKLIK